MVPAQGSDTPNKGPCLQSTGLLAQYVYHEIRAPSSFPLRLGKHKRHHPWACCVQARSTKHFPVTHAGTRSSHPPHRHCGPYSCPSATRSAARRGASELPGHAALSCWPWELCTEAWAASRRTGSHSRQTLGLAARVLAWGAGTTQPAHKRHSTVLGREADRQLGAHRPQRKRVEGNAQLSTGKALSVGAGPLSPAGVA